MYSYGMRFLAQDSALFHYSPSNSCVGADATMVKRRGSTFRAGLFFPWRGGECIYENDQVEEKRESK